MADIELREFVKSTLVEIALGVSEANTEMHKEHGGEYSNSPFRLHKNLGDRGKTVPGISFDIAVTAASGSTDAAGAKISVAHVFGVGGSTEAISSDTQAHRIRFTVGLYTDWD